MSYTTLATPESVQRTMEAVMPRGVTAELVESKEAALAKLQTLIPPGAALTTGSSTTLRQIGFEDLLKSGDHPWRNLKAEMLAEKDPAKQSELRKQSTLAEYFLGSAHAIAETGELVFASNTGSQLPAYAYSSSNVIWVAGTQKITPTLEDALRRVREYCLPMEDQRVKNQDPSSGSFIGKILIFERESPFLRRNLTLILVNEVVGF
jgi:hypothetical protein